ncbi:MAG: hypothetical protein AAFO94_07700, partial [Bacteroidota bacterium]
YISEKDWMAHKIAHRKYDSLMRLAEHWQEASMDQMEWSKMTDASIMERLTALQGVGSQTAHMILMYTLGRPDVFPVDDYHLKIIMAKVYGLGTGAKARREMLAIAEPWSPHRSLATHYLLAYKKLLNKK